MAVDVAGQRLALGVVDGIVAQAHDLGVLGGHVHQSVGRNAAVAVGEPLEQVGVTQGAHAHRRALVVDLGVQVRHLELAHVLGDGAHLAVTQQNGRVAVDDGNLAVVHFLDVLGELQRVGLQHVGILLGIAGEDGHGHDSADGHEHHHRHRHKRQDAEGLGLALVLRHFLGAGLVLLAAHPEDEEQRQQDDNEDKAPEVGRVNVDGRVEPPVGARDNEQGHQNQHREPLLGRQVEVVGQKLEINRGAAVAARTRAAPAASAAVACAAESAEAPEREAPETAHAAARARGSRAAGRAGAGAAGARGRARAGRLRAGRSAAAHVIGVHARLAQSLQQGIQTRLCH